MKELKIVEEREVLGKDFKMYGTVEEPLFLAKDVAEWIEYSKDSKGNYNVSVMLSKVDNDEKVKHFTNLNSSKVGSNTWFLTEDGLYEVLMQSRKPIAKSFKKKVKEILKDVRKHGIYATDNVIDTMLSDPDTMIELLTNYKAEKEKRIEAEEQVKTLEPKAVYYDKILNNPNLLSVSQIAKDYGMSARAFNTMLKDMKIQYRSGKQWFLYAKYQKEKYTHSSVYIGCNNYGQEITNTITKWTQNGRKFLYNRLKEDGILPMIEQS